MKYTDYFIAVDFDDTLAEDAWPGVGEPKQDVIDKLHKRILEKEAEGFKVYLILWTCRSGESCSRAVEWCKSQGIEIDFCNCNPIAEIAWGSQPTGRKIFAHEYWDDRAVAFGDKHAEVVGGTI